MSVLARYGIALDAGAADSDFCTELVMPTLEAVFVEFGREAVDPLLYELKRLEKDITRLLELDAWIGLSVVADSLMEIAFELCDPVLAAQVGLALVSVMRVLLGQVRVNMPVDDTFWNLARGLASIIEAVKTLGFIPQIRTLETLALIRFSMRVIYATGERGKGVNVEGWAEICASLGQSVELRQIEIWCRD